MVTERKEEKKIPFGLAAPCSVKRNSSSDFTEQRRFSVARWRYQEHRLTAGQNSEDLFKHAVAKHCVRTGKALDTDAAVYKIKSTVAQSSQPNYKTTRDLRNAMQCLRQIFGPTKSIGACIPLRRLQLEEQFRNLCVGDWTVLGDCIVCVDLQGSGRCCWRGPRGLSVRVAAKQQFDRSAGNNFNFRQRGCNGTSTGPSMKWEQ